MPYKISGSYITPDMPSPGWYYNHTAEDGTEQVFGPFYSREDALDHESDGAYSSWLEDKRHERWYVEDEMREAGRGHLIRLDD